MMGTGRALPHKGLSELHPWSTSEASTRAPRGSEKAPILFIWDRTTDGGYGVPFGFAQHDREILKRDTAVESLVSQRARDMGHPAVQTLPGWLCLRGCGKLEG
jgi:hypothetical protein